MKKAKELNDASFDAIAQRFRLLGDPLRLKLLNLLRTGEHSVGALVEATGASQPNVSKHLSLLHGGGMLRRRQSGNLVYYEVSDPAVFDLCEIVCGGIERDLDERRSAFGG